MEYFVDYNVTSVVNVMTTVSRLQHIALASGILSGVLYFLLCCAGLSKFLRKFYTMIAVAMMLALLTAGGTLIASVVKYNNLDKAMLDAYKQYEPYVTSVESEPLQTNVRIRIHRDGKDYEIHIGKRLFRKK